MGRAIAKNNAGTIAVSEKAFQQAVIDLARLSGWHVFHVYESRRSPAGFPDLVLVRHATMLCLELKTDVGTVTPAQATWLAALGEVTTVQAGIWRPRDWPQIERQLLMR